MRRTCRHLSNVARTGKGTSKGLRVELKSLRSERPLTRKFRAPQSLAILTAAAQLVRDARAALSSAGVQTPGVQTPAQPGDELAELLDGIAEAEALCAPAAAAGAGDADDAV